MLRVRIMGKTWRLRFVPRLRGHGDCDAPDTPRKEIRIHSGLRGEHRLEILIHEMLHAADWHRSEEWVSQVSKDIARTLHRLNYRQGD